MAYPNLEADKLSYMPQPKKILPKLTNTDTGFSPLGNTNNSIIGNNYSYAPGSAQGPLNYNQQQQAQNTGTANIVPSTTQVSQPTTPVVNPYDKLQKILDEKYATDGVDKTQAKTDMIDKQKAADLQALKDSIASRTSDINAQISGADEKFQPMKNNVDVVRAQDLQRAKELMAAQGVFGGDNLTAQMNVNNQASGNMAGVDQKEIDYQNQLRSQIAALQDASNQQQTGVISKASSDKLATIENEANRLSGVNSSYVSNLAKIIGDMQTQNNSDRDYNRNITNDTTDNNYKNGVLINTANNNLMDYNSKMAQNKTTEAKNMAEASGYSMPSYAQTQIPDSVLQQLAPYSGNYAKAANDLYQSNPDLARWAGIASIQKMFQNPSLLDQYGQPYATLDNKKYQYGVAKDNRDYNYTAGRDNVKDNQWNADYGLKNWTAQDSSARGWNSNAISQQNSDISAYSAQTGRMNHNLNKSKIDDADIDKNLGFIESDYRTELGDTNSNGIKSNYYLNTEGSTQRKDLFNRMATALMDTDIPAESKTKKLLDRGFTANEIKSWLPNN